jgi:hypothetical protein
LDPDRRSKTPQHDRVMRRTYEEKDTSIVTHALIWKDPKFSNKNTAPYIVIDIHYKKSKPNSGYIGGVFAKDVYNVDLKPETDKQVLDGLAIPICKYLESVHLSNPPENPRELQDFDGDFNLKAKRTTQNLDAYQDRNGHRRR